MHTKRVYTKEKLLSFKALHTDMPWLAERYANATNVLGADVFNEPFGGTWATGAATDMDAFAVTAAARIRQSEWQSLRRTVASSCAGHWSSSRSAAGSMWGRK